MTKEEILQAQEEQREVWMAEWRGWEFRANPYVVAAVEEFDDQLIVGLAHTETVTRLRGCGPVRVRHYSGRIQSVRTTSNDAIHNTEKAAMLWVQSMAAAKARVESTAIEALAASNLDPEKE